VQFSLTSLVQFRGIIPLFFYNKGLNLITEKNTPDLGEGKRRTTGPVPLVRALFLTLIMKKPQITGYDILHLTPETINASIKMKTGTVYTELRRLEKFGFVKSIQTPEGRKSRHYEITTAGIDELKALNQQIKNRIKYLIEPLLELMDSTL